MLTTKGKISFNFYNQGVIRKLYISVISRCTYFLHRPHSFYGTITSLSISRKSIPWILQKNQNFGSAMDIFWVSRCLYILLEFDYLKKNYLTLMSLDVWKVILVSNQKLDISVIRPSKVSYKLPIELNFLIIHTVQCRGRSKPVRSKLNLEQNLTQNQNHFKAPKPGEKTHEKLLN